MSYLIRGEGGEEDKTTLAQKDIRFARTIQRLQRSLVSELEKMAIVHLYTLGYRGEDLTNFKLKFEIQGLRLKIEEPTQKLETFCPTCKRLHSRWPIYLEASIKLRGRV